MKINFYAPQGFEPWDYRNPGEKGIGGSETQVVECARRLAARGYEVTVYAPIPDKGPGGRAPDGDLWLPLPAANFDLPGLWIIERAPSALDRFTPRPDQTIWHVCQDVFYFDDWTEERAAKVSRIMALCGAHADNLKATFSYAASKVCRWSNGIPTERLPAGGEEGRDPKRLIWASSPDRGLENLLRIFQRAYEFDPGLSLECFYGFDNWDKIIADNPGVAAMKARVVKLLDQPGVTWHGRIGQDRLHEEFRRSGLWCYPTGFTETSCITCMTAQALGAVPITNPYWALADNVHHGVFIEGNPDDYLTRARYVAAILDLANDPKTQARIRAEMESDAREWFDWEKQVGLWEYWMEYDCSPIRQREGTLMREAVPA